MSDDKILQETIKRIEEMEQYLDEVLRAVDNNERYLNEEVEEKLQKLTQYYESGQWLQDYECDERGELPADLKRGVLSQDLLYNLLCEIENREMGYNSYFFRKGR